MEVYFGSVCVCVSEKKKKEEEEEKVVIKCPSLNLRRMLLITVAFASREFFYYRWAAFVPPKCTTLRHALSLSFKRKAKCNTQESQAFHWLILSSSPSSSSLLAPLIGPGRSQSFIGSHTHTHGLHLMSPHGPVQASTQTSLCPPLDKVNEG